MSIEGPATLCGPMSPAIQLPHYDLISELRNEHNTMKILNCNLTSLEFWLKLVTVELGTVFDNLWGARKLVSVHSGPL